MIFRFLLVFLAIYWVSRLLRRFVVSPYRGSNAGNSQSRGGNTSSFNKQEGDVSVSYDPTKRKSKQKTVGDYVDFEEIEEEGSKK